MSYTNPFTETFDYEKHWTNAEDFPTFEAEESQVRADMQELYTEIAGALNTLTAALKAVTAAGYLGVTGAADSKFENASTVQEALQALSDAIDALVAQTVPADSITHAMLKDNCVEANNIKDGEVTTAKIADTNVTTAKIAGGAVTTAKIADLNVTNAKIANGAVTPAKVTFTSDPLTIGASGVLLTLNGPIKLSASNYGNSTPPTTPTPTTGQLFFLKA